MGLAQSVLHARLANTLAEIADALPKEYTVSFLARNKANPDAHILVTDDKPEALIEALEKLKGRPIE